jgi:hypothetical protein
VGREEFPSDWISAFQLEGEFPWMMLELEKREERDDLVKLKKTWGGELVELEESRLLSLGILDDFPLKGCLVTPQLVHQ